MFLLAFLIIITLTPTIILAFAQADPYELSPLDLSAPEHTALSTRLNGLLLASKSCEQNSCRSPWSILHPDGSVATLRDALEGKHDAFYASLPRVAFRECLDYLQRDNEEPYFPPFTDGVGPTLGELYRLNTDSFGLGAGAQKRGPAMMIPEMGHFGERYEGAEAIEACARALTDEELAMPVTDFYAYGEL